MTDQNSPASPQRSRRELWLFPGLIIQCSDLDLGVIRDRPTDAGPVVGGQ